jgi:hypothetical protein
MQIYKITNLINSKIYIGKDTNSNKNYYGSGVILKNAIKKYGIENFNKEIIDTAENNEELSKKEKYWIDFYNSTNKEIGYNISKGGDGGDTISNNPNRDIINEKISKSSLTRGKTYEESYGTDKALEYKKKLSEAHKNRPPRLKKEKPIKEDGRKKRWECFRENIKITRNKMFESVLEKIRKDGILYNIEEIDFLKRNRIKFMISSIEDFYKIFAEFGDDIHEYYKLKESEKRSKSHSGRLHEKHTKEKIKNKKKEVSRRYFQYIIKIIDDNNIQELEDYFSENDSKNIRKRFLKGLIKDEIPEKYIKIIKKKKRKKHIIPEGSLKSMEKKLGKKIEIDGEVYDSITGASKKLGIDRNWVRYRIINNRWPDKYNKIK